MKHTLLLFFLLLSFFSYAKKDTLYLKPHFMLVYDRGLWHGPSGADIDTNDYRYRRRYENEYYLFPGWAGEQDVTHNWVAVNDIRIRSGYADQLQYATGENYYGAEKINARLLYKYSHKLQLDEDGKSEILESEIIEINGLNFHFSKIRQKIWRDWSKPPKTVTFYKATLDTIFDDNTFLSISGRTEWGGKNYLARRIERFTQITRIDPAVLDKLHDQRFKQDEFSEATEKSVEDWKDYFDYNDRGQLSCSGAESIHMWTMGEMTLEEVVALLSDFDYENLADSIINIHRRFARKSSEDYIHHLASSRYSAKKEWQWYQEIANGKTDIDAYLNYMNGDTVPSFLDTLDIYVNLRALNAYDIYRALQQDDPGYFTDYLYRKFERNVEPEFCRQFAMQELNFKDSSELFYRKVTDGTTREIYLFSIDDEWFTAPVLAVFNRHKSGDWKFNIYHLTFNPLVEGETAITSFNELYTILGQGQALVLNGKDSNVEVVSLFAENAIFQEYPVIIYSLGNMLDAPKSNGMIVNTITPSLLPEDQLEHIRKTIKETPSFNQGKLTHYNDSLISDDRFAKSIRLQFLPSQILYRQVYKVADISGDGKTELFYYDICDGKIVNLQCYTTENGKVKEVDRSQAEQWLQGDEQFNNLMNYSRLGWRNTFN